MLLSILQRLRQNRPYSIPKWISKPISPMKKQLPKSFEVRHGMLIVTPLDRMLAFYLDAIFIKNIVSKDILPYKG